ncbi:MAG: pyridoxamine 5'-phosphate oxidase family protein [Anaerovoracaceae bacterium]|jgi:nitroimidazol reductase NimA-like FMN-containing flavoprotein (pyridoxamine 5'-phosphate oxidase superfamily)
MRRKDRQMDADFGLNVIDKSRYATLSLVDKNEPYSIPLSIARHGNHLYFHSAMAGRKVDLFKQNPKVSIVFVGDTKIPELYSEACLDKICQDQSKTALLIKNVFTTEYESAIVEGTVSLVIEEGEKENAMRAICEKYVPSKMKYFDTAIRTGLSRTNVYRIEIQSVKAKRKKYDSKFKKE